MIIGHIGAAYAAKRFSPRCSLAVLLLASFAPDILREFLLWLNLSFFEANVRSHASPWCLELSVGVGFLTWLITGDRITGIVSAFLVLSHVILDAVSGHKLLWYWGPSGYNLESKWPYDFLLQSALLIAGVVLLRRGSAPRWASRRFVVAILILMQLAVEIGAISQRPYLSRCWEYPFRPCDDSSWLRQRWNVKPFWEGWR